MMIIERRISERISQPPVHHRRQFDEVCKLVQEDVDTKLLERADHFFWCRAGGWRGLSGTAGPLALLGPKNELVKIGKALVKKVAGRRETNFVRRYERMAAAHQLLGRYRDLLTGQQPATDWRS